MHIDQIKSDNGVLFFSGSKFSKWSFFVSFFFHLENGLFANFGFPISKEKKKKAIGCQSSAKYMDREVIAQVFGSERMTTWQLERTKKKKMAPLAIQRINDSDVASVRCSQNET